FIGGMIATSRVESVNAYLKRLLYSSNISLCDLLTEITRLLDIQNRENEYKFWKLSIPNMKNQDKVNFLFTNVDKCIQKFLTSTILQMQYNEINQSVYYMSNVIKDMMHFSEDDDSNNSHEEFDSDD
ncbi:3687_t:CDS:2, partial [Dentiscutata heterogama]